MWRWRWCWCWCWLGRILVVMGWGIWVMMTWGAEVVEVYAGRGGICFCVGGGKRWRQAELVAVGGG